MSWRVLERSDSRLVLRDRPWLAWGAGLVLAAAAVAVILVFAEAATLRLERAPGGPVRGSLVRRRALGKETLWFAPGEVQGVSVQRSEARIERFDPEGTGKRVETRTYSRVVLDTASGPVPLLRVFRAGDGPSEDERRIAAFLAPDSSGTLVLMRDERGSTLVLSLLLLVPAALLAGRRSLTVTADAVRGIVELRWRGVPWSTRREIPRESIRSVWVVLGVPGMAWLALETTDGAPVPLRLFAIGGRRAQEEAGDLLRGFLIPGDASATAPREALRPEAW